jgi:hypothetical protein
MRKKVAIYWLTKENFMLLPAWSLVGFLNETEAIAYLQRTCVMPSRAPSILRDHYRQAKKKLGNGVISRPGRPDIQDIPAGYEEYLAGVLNNPRFKITTQVHQSWSFKFVEIDALLAKQFHVLVNKVNDVRSKVSLPPTIEEMLAICLPHQLENVPFELLQTGNGTFIIRSDDLNIRPQSEEMISNPVTQLYQIGPAFGVSSNLVQVGNVEGRYFLHNGFHRAVALSMAGAIHMPCILFEAKAINQVGPTEGFSAAICRSPNPPTVGHFSRGLGDEVQLKQAKKELVISFSIRERLISAD